MKEYDGTKQRKGASAAFRRGIVTFLVLAFVLTASFELFLKTMAQSTGFELTGENIRLAAILTFINALCITFLFTVADGIRRNIMVERPVRYIVEAAGRIIKGDYTAHIPPLKNYGGMDGYDVIIDYFNKMADELSGVETLRTDFIANVSHELKSPLAVMQNYGTLLQQPGLSEDKRIEYAKALTETCRRLAGLISNILKLNRLENQQIYPEITSYNLGEQLAECLLNFESTWEKKEIKIQTELEEDVMIESDAELMTLVWNNLFSNAFKFTELGGTVSLSLKSEEAFAVVKVQDTGCGISPEVGRHIFEKFYQGDTSHATQGNGLGLALVRRVVDIIGGDISVESQVGKGSTFIVKIRRATDG